MAEYGSTVGSDASTPSPGETGQDDYRPTREVLRASRDQAMEEARDAIRNMAEGQKTRAAEGLGSVAHALHETARTLSSEKQAVTARYTDMAADQLERASRLLREKDWDDLMGEAERFARQQPTLFIGGAIAAGFFLARFLKSVPATPAGTGRTETAAGSAVGAPYGGVAGSSYTGAMGGEG